MKQAIGSTQYLGYTSYLTLDLAGTPSTKKRKRGTGTILILSILLCLLLVETQAVNLTLKKEIPLETKYSFKTLEECVSKQKQLETQHKLNSNLRCVPNGNPN